MSSRAEVRIAGRTFRLGAVYVPRPGTYGRRLRRLLDYTADSLLPGGRVKVAMMPSGRRCTMTGEEWSAWAGEEVET